MKAYKSFYFILLLGSYANNHQQQSFCQALSLQAATRSKIAASIAKSQRRADARSIQPRERCAHCNRPQVQCLCDALPKTKIALQNTKVLVLQHPAEFRKSTISTVPLLSLVLDGVEVVVGRKFDASTRVIQEALNDNYTLALLYPSEEAIDLDNPTKEEQDLLGMGPSNDESQISSSDTSKTLLIACDGTWSQARRMFLNSPELISVCHQVQFTSSTSTVYDQIRTEPEDFCLSTSEAVAEALIRLEPNGEVAKQYIHSALEKLVDVQLQHSSNEHVADPRFQTKKQTMYAKLQKRLEIEQSLFSSDTNFSFDLGDGSIVRPLELKDVDYVSRVNDDRSIHKIADLIRFHPNYCLGIERNGELVACTLRYRSGEIGMLYVDSSCRRRGYASTLIQEVVRRIEAYEETNCVETFIVDGNHASHATFGSLGFKPEEENQKRGTGKRKAKRKWIYHF